MGTAGRGSDRACTRRPEDGTNHQGRESDAASRRGCSHAGRRGMDGSDPVRNGIAAESGSEGDLPEAEAIRGESTGSGDEAHEGTNQQIAESGQQSAQDMTATYLLTMASKSSKGRTGKHCCRSEEKAFPNLEVTSDVFINQHRVTFKNEDGQVLDIQYIDRGGAAKDPITRELLPIATPTKAPTIDQTFTFNTWDKLLSPILEDTVITATYKANVRQYTVSFYSVNDLLYQETVDVYTAAKYVGSTPKRAEVAGSYLYYLFTGWDKAFDNVTSDLKVYAVFAECGVPARKVELTAGQKLTDVYTVNEIYAICRSDMAKEYFETLDEIEIPLDTTVVKDTSIVLQVYTFNHFKRADDSGEFAHVAFGMKGTLTATRQMNTKNVNAGGFEATDMNTWLNGEMYEALPQAWKSMISEVEVLASKGDQSSTIVKSKCKLFLWSQAEVGFDTAAVPYKNEIDPDAEEKKLPIFTDNASRIKKTFNGEGNAVNWWLRSPDSGSSTNFRAVYSYGGAYSNFAANWNSVCFGFCVG